MSIWDFLNKSAFHIGAILVSLSCITYLSIKWHINSKRTKYFMGGMVCLIVQALSSIILIYGLYFCESEIRRSIYESANYLYFVSHGLMAPFLFVYGLIATHIFTRLSRRIRFAALIPFMTTELLILTNPLTKWVWYHEADGTFHRQWGEYYMYFISFVYIVVSLWLVFGWWEGISKRKKKILGWSFIISLLGVLVQLLFPELEVELFGESITMLGVTLSIEYDDEWIDPSSRVYNRKAMLNDLGVFMHFKKGFHVLTVRIMDIKYLNTILCISTGEIQARIGEKLAGVYERSRIYRATPDVFLFYIPENDTKKVESLAEAVRAALTPEVDPSGAVIPIKFAISYAMIPRELSSISDILLLCESEDPDVKPDTITSGSDLEYIFFRDRMEKALSRGLENHNFKIDYQLIYSPDDLSVCGAESLLRLVDPEFGELKPDDFIQTAERTGLIDRLGMYVLGEVCEFINSRIPERAGIEYISVNLSVVQCMDVEFVEKTSRLVHDYGVDPDMINFEITEAIASTDYRYISRVVSRLHDEGFRVTVQGYGLGYSDKYSIFSMDFDTVKLDKTLLWAAEASEEGRIVFESSIRLIKDLGRQITAVGVETAEQMKRVRSMDVDNIQGYYFSSPMSAEELTALVRA